MKHIAIVLILAAACQPMAGADLSFTLRAEDDPVEMSDSKARLQLNTSIVKQAHACADFVGFTLRLTFKNVGDITVILDKRIIVTNKMVSRDLEAAEAKQYEVTGRFTNDTRGAGDPVDISNFIILEPGEVYSTDFGIGSYSISDSVPPPKGYLNPGTYYLQVAVSTWSYYEGYKPLQQKWKDTGFLWAEGLISKPMPFTIKEDHKLKTCRR